MIVKVKLLKGEEVNIDIPQQCTIRSLKEAASCKLQVPLEHQSLVFKGRTLLDEQTVQDCGISEGTRIHMVTRRKDAGPYQQEVKQQFQQALTKLLGKQLTAEQLQSIGPRFMQLLYSSVQDFSLDDLEKLLTPTAN